MNILYLSYTGIGEPLGVSQVLAYLRVLSSLHRITLITFEKPENLDDAALMADRQAQCDAAGIRWIHLRYHQRPRLLSTAWDMFVFLLTAIREAIRQKAEIIHARNYISTSVALICSTLTFKPFIFDTRAFWPEELIAAGRLRRGSALHRFIVFGESLCMRRAGGIVFLTHAARDHIRANKPELSDADLVVIPTCADLDRFAFDDGKRADGHPLRVVSIGTVLSGWFKLDLMFAVFKAIRAARPDSVFTIISRDDPERIRAAAARNGFDPSDIVMKSLPPEDIPAALRDADVVPLFYATGLARLAGFPTRMAEALGSGVPVLCNADSGEVAHIVAENGVGTLIDDRSEAEIARGVAAFVALADDPALPRRCRDTAERLFSLTSGAQEYDALYQRITARSEARS